MRMYAFIFLVPLSLFASVGDFSHQDEMKEACAELELPVQSEDKKEFQERWIRWILKKKNHDRLLQKIKSQIIEGEFASSEELSSMVASLELALDKWNEADISKKISMTGVRGKTPYEDNTEAKNWWEFWK